MTASRSQVLMRELFGNIATTLIRVQLAERQLKACITWLGTNPEETLEGLEARRETLRKRTIGFLLKELRKKVEIEQSFDALLQDFLEKRNLFAHDLMSVPSFSLKDDDIAVGIDFLRDLASKADNVHDTFQGFNKLFFSSRDAAPPNSEVPTEDEIREWMALLRLKLK